MPRSELRFDGRVAVVTGAGRGIGLAYSSLLAARGASVMLNDLGTAMEGGSRDSSVADQAAAELRRLGGRVEADDSDISTTVGAEALVAHAVDAFGSVDIVVNNAGIFWADSFPDVEPDKVEQQWAVHVGGTFRVTRAAWPHLVRSGRGRVVMTSSSGALGSATLAAYGTAKAGVLGLARSLAMTGRPDGVKVNVVAPMAMSRMMQAGMKNAPVAAALADDRDPRYVAPLVAILCHDICPTSGETFNAGMRRYSRFVIAESDGYLHPSANVSPEELLGHWAEVMDVPDLRVVTDTMSWSQRHFALLAGHPDSA